MFGEKNNIPVMEVAWNSELIDLQQKLSNSLKNTLNYIGKIYSSFRPTRYDK